MLSILQQREARKKELQAKRNEDEGLVEHKDEAESKDESKDQSEQSKVVAVKSQQIELALGMIQC